MLLSPSPSTLALSLLLHAFSANYKPQTHTATLRFFNNVQEMAHLFTSSLTLSSPLPDLNYNLERENQTQRAKPTPFLYLKESHHFLQSSNTLSFSPLSLKLSSSALTARRNGSGFLGARMNASAAASYASALADVANSNNTLETTSGDVEKIEKFFGEPSVFDFFINPTIGLEKKRQVLDDIAKSSALQPHTINFLNILVDAKRIDLIKDIVKGFEVVYNKTTDTELAIVGSVVKLESQHLAQIAKQVQKLMGAKNVRIKTEIDPSLVAGFTVRYGQSGSKLIDLSVKKQLRQQQ